MVDSDTSCADRKITDMIWTHFLAHRKLSPNEVHLSYTSFSFPVVASHGNIEVLTT